MSPEVGNKPFGGVALSGPAGGAGRAWASLRSSRNKGKRQGGKGRGSGGAEKEVWRKRERISPEKGRPGSATGSESSAEVIVNYTDLSPSLTNFVGPRRFNGLSRDVKMARGDNGATSRVARRCHVALMEFGQETNKQIARPLHRYGFWNDFEGHSRLPTTSTSHVSDLRRCLYTAILHLLPVV